MTRQTSSGEVTVLVSAVSPYRPVRDEVRAAVARLWVDGDRATPRG
jgi:hypothetical protein